MLLHVSICGREPDTEGDYLPYSAPGDGTDMETAAAVPNPGQRTETIDEYRNYFWDFGQVQLLTDTRECVRFLEQSAADTECGRRL